MLNIQGLAGQVFFFTHIVKNNDTPGAGPVLTQGLLFEQSL
jgi:hypothetical protein